MVWRARAEPCRTARAARTHARGVRVEGCGLTCRDSAQNDKLLLMLLRSRGWLDRALERIGPGEFREPAYRAIFEALVENPGLEGPTEGLLPEAALAFEGLARRSPGRRTPAAGVLGLPLGPRGPGPAEAA